MSAQRKIAAKPAKIATLAASIPERQRVLVDGEIVALLPDDAVTFVTTSGRRLKCACAMGVDLAWLRAALRLGHVRAEGSVARRGAGGGVIWCLVPTAEQRRAIPDEINLVAAEGVNIVCGKSKLKLTKDGSLRARGREVAIRGSRSTRIQGGIVRVN
jgi:hypothetical protein